MNWLGWLGVAVGAGALVFAGLAWWISRKQLRLAEEQATLRPRLAVSFREVMFHYRPPNPGSPLVQAAIVFDIANDGRSAARNVNCKIRLEEQDLVPDEMHGPNRDFYAERLGPESSTPYSINAGIRSYGSTKAHYRCVCDEVGVIEDVIEFEVPKEAQE